jgi:hypothetical protein
MDSQILELLASPRDKQTLWQKGDRLVCEQGHRYSVIDGVPIFARFRGGATLIEGTRALETAAAGDAFILPRFNVRADEIDPFVRNASARQRNLLSICNYRF